MRTIFILLLAGFTFLLLYFLFLLRAKKDRLVFKIKILVAASIEILVSNILIAVAKNELIALLSYAMYFVGLDWLLLFMMSFCYEYTMNRRTKPIFKHSLSAIIALDTVSFALNVFTHHAFTLQKAGDFSSWKFFPTIFYNLHLALDYIIVLVCIFYLTRAIIFAPSIYKIKYALVLAAISTIVGVNAVHMYSRTAFDVSVLFYPLFTIAIYYIACVYIPHQLMTMTMRAVTDDFKNALLMVDLDGNCVYENASARKMFQNEKISESEILDLLGGDDLFNHPSCTTDFEREKDGKIHHYRSEFNRLECKNGRFIGCYFNVIDVTDEMLKLEQEHFRATHDVLTGLFNKEYFYELVSERLDSDRENDYLMLCSNVVNFKLINDQYGTKRGDEVLKRIAEEIRRLSAKSDICGRLDADRFAILMSKKNFSEELFLIESLKSLNLLDDVAYSVICQIGVYAIEERNILVSIMCDRAFLALETIKKDVSKQIAYYDERLRQTALREQEIISAIPSALRNNEIQVFLQPQVDRSGKVLGAEALVRWFSEGRGKIPTKDFITTLENNGMIAVVDHYVWETACRQLAKWKRDGHEDLYISVNISPKDLYLLDIFKTLCDLVKKYSVQPKNLRLEITEAAVLLDAERQSKIIDNLRSAGFNVEMDDFGRGYSSLNTLKNFAMDELKIDLAFLNGAKDMEKGRKILEKMISMSKEIGLKVVTEGVETAEQVDFLHSVGSDIYQGYFFSEPIPISDFDEKYLQKKAENV